MVRQITNKIGALLTPVREWWTGTWAWDVNAGLRPLWAIVASGLLVLGASIWLHFELIETGPLFAYSPAAPLYLYSAIAQSLAAYMTLALTALFIASQLLGPNYSWGFSRLLVSQPTFQVALGINLGVITTSLLFLATPDCWGIVGQQALEGSQPGAVGNTPLIMVILAFAALIMLTYYVVNAVLSLEPSRFVEQCTRQAQQVIAAGYCTSREEYLSGVIRVLRDTAIIAPERAERQEENVELVAHALADLRRAMFARIEWDGSEARRRVVQALLAVGQYAVRMEEGETEERPEPQVWPFFRSIWRLGRDAYQSGAAGALDDAYSIALRVAQERHRRQKENWLDSFRNWASGLVHYILSMQQRAAQAPMPMDEARLLEIPIHYLLLGALDAVREGNPVAGCEALEDLWHEMRRFLSEAAQCRRRGEPPPISTKGAEFVLSALTDALMALGAAFIYEKDTESQAGDFVKCTGQLLYQVARDEGIEQGTMLEEALARFDDQPNRTTRVLLDSFHTYGPLEMPFTRRPSVVHDISRDLARDFWVLVRCYWEANYGTIAGFDTIKYSHTASWLSSLTKDSDQGRIVDRWADAMMPLLRGKELSLLLDALMDKSDEFRVQREQAESSAIRAKPFSPEAKAQFVKTVTETFEQSRVVARLLRRSDALAHGQPVDVAVRLPVYRQSFVANAGPVAGIENVGHAFAAREDWRLLYAVTDFVRSELSCPDLQPEDVSEMVRMLGEVYDESPCLIVSNDVYILISNVLSFGAVDETQRPSAAGRLGPADLYVTEELEPGWVVSFIKEQIGDLAVTAPLQISDPVDLPPDEGTATNLPLVRIELSEELQIALSADGEPRVWDLSQWIST